MARKASRKTADSSANLGFETTALRGSASSLLHSSFQLPTFPVLANRTMSSNLSGDCPARSASSKPKAKPQSLQRQRDIRRALIEADLVDTAPRDRAFPESEATPQVPSEAKNNMVALPGQLFYSTQIPVCLWFLVENKPALRTEAYFPFNFGPN